MIPFKEEGVFTCFFVQKRRQIRNHQPCLTKTHQRVSVVFTSHVPTERYRRCRGQMIGMDQAFCRLEHHHQFGTGGFFQVPGKALQVFQAFQIRPELLHQLRFRTEQPAVFALDQHLEILQITGVVAGWVCREWAQVTTALNIVLRQLGGAGLYARDTEQPERNQRP